MALTILALDTSTEACSVALLHNGNIISDFVMAQREHTQQILPMVDKILNEAGCTLSQVDAIAFGRGPGSFTGVRIGIGIAQGLAFGADKPLLPISTLATLAQTAYRQVGAMNVVAAIDARMNEVYCGQYQRQQSGEWQILAAERVIKPEQVTSIVTLSDKQKVYAAGTGWQAYPNMLANITPSAVLLPDAQDMLPLAEIMWQKGERFAAADVEPTYLRNEVTWKKLPGRE